jgi:hypothetical protein
MINFRKRNRKTVHDYYSMDSFACGFETRSCVEGQPASHFLTAHAHSVRVARCRQTGTLPGCPVNAQRNSVIISDVLLISFPKLLTTFPKTKKTNGIPTTYRYGYGSAETPFDLFYSQQQYSKTLRASFSLYPSCSQ